MKKETIDKDVVPPQLQVFLLRELHEKIGLVRWYAPAYGV